MISILDRFLAVVLRGVVRYRFNVISTNLQTSFPDLSNSELERIISQNYQYMARVIREIAQKPSKKLFEEKLKLLSHPVVEESLNESRSVIVVMGHVGNWEWAGLYTGLKYPGKVCALYKKIKTPWVNKLMLSRRSATVDHLIEIKKMGDLLRLIKKQPIIILMIADQNPGNDQGIVWTKFLNKKTAFTSGPETLAIKYNLPVVYLNSLLNQNVYELEFKLITDNPKNMEKGQITQLYAEALERNIIENTAEWLWSHKRWKRSEK